jgi:O-antigen/teichoic acid export membrane protein
MWRSIFGNFSIRVLSALLNLGLVILFSQVSGLVGKGEQSLLLTTIAILTIFDALIGGASLVNFSSKYSWAILLRNSYAWIFALTCLAGIVLYVFSIFSAFYLINVLILSLLSAVVAVHSSLLLGQKRFVAYNFIQIIIPTLTLLTCLFQYGHSGVLNYEVSLYVAYGFAFLSSIYLIWYYYPKEQFEIQASGFIFKKMLTYGAYNQLAHVFQLLSFRVSYYFLEYHHGKSMVGLYSNGSSITESIWLIASSISLWQFATITNAKDRQYTINLTEKLAAFGLTTAMFACIVLVLLPGEFYQFIFGKDFVALKPIMWCLAPGIWVFSYALIVGHYFSGHGRYQVNALASGLGFLISLLGAWMLIPSYGVLGAAITATISYASTSAVVYRYFKDDGGRLQIFPTVLEVKEIIYQAQLRICSKKS